MKRILTLFCGLLLCGLSLSAQQKETVGGVTFYPSDEFAVHGREQLTGEEALMIQPKINPDNERMVLKVQPDALLGIDGLTSEEVSDMLTAAVNSLTDIIVNPSATPAGPLTSPTASASKTVPTFRKPTAVSAPRTSKENPSSSMRKPRW